MSQPCSDEPFVHLEHDGKLFLVDKDGNGPQLPVKGRVSCEAKSGWLIRWPTITEAKKNGFSWLDKGTTIIKNGEGNASVIRACPDIDWPEHWAWKDDVISDSAVHPIAREMVYRSIHRLVSKVIIQDDEGLILMARVKRGFFVGNWSLPGGYMDHNEHPKTGAAREVFEELGIEISIPDPLGEVGKKTTSEVKPCPGCLGEETWCVVSQNMFDSDCISFISFTYKVKVNRKELNFTLKEDEISEVGWFSKEQALDLAVSWFDISAIEKVDTLS